MVCQCRNNESENLQQNRFHHRGMNPVSSSGVWTAALGKDTGQKASTHLLKQYHKPHTEYIRQYYREKQESDLHSHLGMILTIIEKI